MTLSFSTQINGKPNYFIEKVWNGLIDSKIATISDYQNARFEYNDKFGVDWDDFSLDKPKLHTIREDKHDRWKAGNLIHPVINNRRPNRFQFAPCFPCVSIQKIRITDISHRSKIANVGIVIDYQVNDVTFQLYWSVEVSGVELNEAQIKQLAVNDGFDSSKDFFQYFHKSGEYKLIHFTDLRY